MTNALLLEHFDGLLSTPEDVELLNHAILQLAVKGKLVKQYQEDEMASELLIKIQQDIESIIGFNPKYSDSNFIAPFSLPNNWVWSELGKICIVIMGQSPASSTYNTNKSGLPFYQGKKDFGEMFPTPTQWCSEPSKVAKENDVLISVRAPVGPTNLCQEKSCIGRGLAALRSVSGVLPKYILYAMRAFEKILAEKGSGTTFIAISGKDLYTFPFPLPPLAEQKRIVARVEELFAQTRALAKELAHSRTELDGLNQSALSHLLGSQTPEEFEGHWSFIAEHFDLLFQAPEHVAPLRQAVLELAVRGKLTRREAGDKSAGELFKRINKEKPLPTIEENEKPFDLPEGWEWVRLENIVSVLGDGLHGTPEYTDDGEYFFVNGNNLSDGNIEIKKNTKRVSQSEYDKHKKELNSRTVFVSINGTIGNLAFYNNEKIILGKSACYFNLLDEVDKFYIGTLIRSPYFLDYARMVASRTTISNVSLKSMRQLMIPLPPLAEQERIVQRVESLLALCDALEARLQSAEEERSRLVAAVMSTVGG
jgi:type I restriction enzyme S subunit